MATETKVQVPYLVPEPVRFPKKNALPPPSRSGDASIAPSQGVLYGVLIGSVLWAALILLGVVLW